MQGAAFGGAKGKPEDADMRSVMCVIQACVAVGPTTSRAYVAARTGSAASEAPIASSTQAIGSSKKPA